MRFRCVKIVVSLLVLTSTQVLAQTSPVSQPGANGRTPIPNLRNLNTIAEIGNYVQPKLNGSIEQVFATLGNCQRFDVDTHSDHGFEKGDHHQSFVLSHRMSNGKALAFISHSEMGGTGVCATDAVKATGLFGTALNELGIISDKECTGAEQGQILAFEVASGRFESENVDLINIDGIMPLKWKAKINEQHPSGIAWLPAPEERDYGYLFIASEEDKKVLVRKYSADHSFGEVASLPINHISTITDVWLAQEGGYDWMILHNMNDAEGEAYRAISLELFDDAGELNFNAFQLVNHYQSPSETGCDKGLGQNAHLVKDSNDDWYVVHSYSIGNAGFPTGKCGVNGSNHKVKAYPASFSDAVGFSVSTDNNSHTVETTIGHAHSGLTFPGGDGASGFQVTDDGRLVAYLGAQYSHKEGTDHRSRIKECASASDPATSPAAVPEVLAVTPPATPVATPQAMWVTVI